MNKLKYIKMKLSYKYNLSKIDDEKQTKFFPGNDNKSKLYLFLITINL